jgi:Zn-dependent protease with chaperone function
MRGRNLVAAAAVAGLLGAAACKTLPKPVTLADWIQLARTGRDAALVAQNLEAQKARCDAIAREPVAFEEEKAIGGSVAVRWVQQTGGLMVDVPAGKLTNELRQVRPADLAENPSRDVTRYLNRVGKNLAAQSARPGLEWTFGVLRSDAVNASSTPGGYVFVTRGLLRLVDNEAQLAAVLGHEIAHVTERHALNEYRKQKAAVCQRAFVNALSEATGANEALHREAEKLALGFDKAMGKGASAFIDLDDAQANLGALVGLADALADRLDAAGLSNAEELAADKLGAELALNAGYNPHEFAKLLAKLPQTRLTYAHHPTAAQRVTELNAWLAALAPKDDPFGRADWPFDDYPKVALGKELDSVRK